MWRPSDNVARVAASASVRRRLPSVSPARPRPGSLSPQARAGGGPSPVWVRARPVSVAASPKQG
eukprot:7096477-Alexandrium_andersonii.AAC.1